MLLNGHLQLKNSKQKESQRPPTRSWAWRVPRLLVCYNIFDLSNYDNVILDLIIIGF